MNGFSEWYWQIDEFEKTRHYKKRRPGAVTGAAKAARRGGGIAKAVNPSNLSKTPNDNPYGKKFQGISVGGPIFKQDLKTHDTDRMPYFRDPSPMTDFFGVQ